MFVDLFAPSLKLYAEQKAPLTIQGIHLNSEGNRRIARSSIARCSASRRGTRRRTSTGCGRRSSTRTCIWFQRYRVPNGYSTYGDRAFLTFVRGNPRNVNADVAAKVPKEDILPTNYEVLQRELPMLDVMTRNRDRRIWAVARGRTARRRRRSTTATRRRSSTPRRTWPAEGAVFLDGVEADLEDDDRRRA